MSTTEIFGFAKDGSAYFLGETKNSWRGGMAVWGILEEKYLPPYLPSYAPPGVLSVDEFERHLGWRPTRTSSIMDEKAMKEIWDLSDSKKVSTTDKIVLFTTFDKCLVKRADIPKVIEAFRNFEGETSLNEQADVLQQALDDEKCIAVGWNQTSVNGDTWGTIGGYDEENDESIPYNCLTQNEHYWLFDELKSMGGENGA
jgi:hypothetical protein